MKDKKYIVSDDIISSTLMLIIFLLYLCMLWIIN